MKVYLIKYLWGVAHVLWADVGSIREEGSIAYYFHLCHVQFRHRSESEHKQHKQVKT